MGALLVVVFLVVPIVELYVIVQVGQEIGVFNTIGLLLIVSVVGAWLMKREGAKAWRAFVGALAETRLPAREVADGALVLFGGALLLTPGFVTDVLGLMLLLPPTRAVARRILLRAARGRLVVPGFRPPGPKRVRSTRVDPGDPPETDQTALPGG